MKFSNGYWMAKEGYTVLNPVDVREVEQKGNNLTVYAAARRIQRKGDTLNGALLTCEISSPIPDVIRVRWTHHAGKTTKGPAFELLENPLTPVTIDESGHQVTLKSGNLSVKINKQETWGREFFYEEKRLTGSNSKGAGHITTDNKDVYFREQLDLGVGEHIYGLGERFTPFVKNGQAVDIWNEDGGTSSEQAYKNVPFYLSSKGYGVFVNHPEHVSFEVGSEVVSKVQFSVPGENIEYFIVGGQTLKDVLNNYTKLTGKPALPPAWSFGLWLTTSFTTNYDEATVNSFIDGMIERDLPLHVFHFDCFWMKEYQWTNFEWDADMFPDPVGMLKRLKDKGLKICVWINSYIGQKSPLFKEGMEQGYLVKTLEDDVWQWDLWQAGMGLVDFTNPAATEWYKGHLRRLIDMGVDCFKTDFGERIPTDVKYHDGSDPLKMHNYYTFLYNKAVFEVLEEKLGKNEAMLFARSATAGGQQFPVHWGGDCSANYDSMAESLRGGLSLGLSGFGFWSHDISGFEKTAPPDIYKRWVAFGLLSSHSRLHGNESYRVPWLFDEEAVDVLRHFTKLKSTLMPYLFESAIQSTEMGIPMMRAMVLDYAADPSTHHLDTQYMLGDNLLVAPIFNDRGQVMYYVPEGRWTDFFGGQIVEGGKWHEETHGYMTLPLLVKPNSLLAIGANDQKPDYDYADGVSLHLFELQDGASAAANLYSLQGELEVTVKVVRRDEEVSFFIQGATKPYTIVLRGIHEVAGVDGAEWIDSANGIVLTPETGKTHVVVSL
ncbi:alpha-xylosidase [Paenibacillus anseongense]|uniref:alpha-xylosidase n=1 Tax=Paenibacillus anseongense TaxID=2682845 RepID=UPI002DB6A2B4|nr:alpha-xylosidase [Paenibacillus anseongense]MEC0269024.1 alpha-xylosidase [Paenibacillus anseongense]